MIGDFFWKTPFWRTKTKKHEGTRSFDNLSKFTWKKSTHPSQKGKNQWNNIDPLNFNTPRSRSPHLKTPKPTSITPPALVSDTDTETDDSDSESEAEVRKTKDPNQNLINSNFLSSCKSVGDPPKVKLSLDTNPQDLNWFLSDFLR